jgi:Zn-dependent alcohol dehydrogenase
VQSRLTLAQELGATDVIDTSSLSSLAMDLGNAIREIVPQGTNANFDTTGVIPIIDAGVQSLHPKGQMVLIGIVDGHMNIDLGKIMTVRSSKIDFDGDTKFLQSGIAIRGCIEGNAKPSKVRLCDVLVTAETNRLALVHTADDRLVPPREIVRFLSLPYSRWWLTLEQSDRKVNKILLGK